MLALRFLKRISPLFLGVAVYLGMHWFINIYDGTLTYEKTLIEGATIFLILMIGWTGLRLITFFEQLFLARLNMSKKDNLRERRMSTLIMLFRRLAVVIIFVITLGFILMQFEQIKNIGVSLLASAGVAGIIIGFAAQKSLGNIIAGLQIAITQPIRLDDVVVVEGEWGWVEEITLTYVVIRIWDWRRLILPISYFIEKPFQNWTRRSSSLIGSVYFHMDYRIPVSKVREKLDEIVQQSDYWDKHVCVLHVVEATDKTIQLRAIATSSDSPSSWELRCFIREKIIEWIQEEYPEYLPRTRAMLEESEIEIPIKQSGSETTH